jgi:hypothetical protein
MCLYVSLHRATARPPTLVCRPLSRALRLQVPLPSFRARSAVSVSSTWPGRRHWKRVRALGGKNLTVNLRATRQPCSCRRACTSPSNLCPQPCLDPVPRVVPPCRGRGIPHAGAHSFIVLGKPKAAPLATLGDPRPCCRFQQLGKPRRQQALSLRRPFWVISSCTSWPCPKAWMGLLALACTHAQRGEKFYL